jgi:hypothetical protein
VTSEDGTLGLEKAEQSWGDKYAFSHDPDDHDQPYAARRRDGQVTLRAATPALLLDAVKDDSRNWILGGLA